MKKILIVLSTANLHQLNTVESISAAMVLATFGSEVHVLLQGAALSLLASDLSYDASTHAFKLASNLVDSFEFYDIESIYIEEKHAKHPLVHQAQSSIQCIEFNHNFIQQFHHILSW